MSDQPTYPEDTNQGNSQDFSDGFVGFTQDETSENMSAYQAPETQPEQHLAPQQAAADTFMPVASSKRFSLTNLEKLCVILIFVALVTGAVSAIILFSTKIPTKSPTNKDVSLPVKGERFTVSSVETYWRKPITEGENPDIIRSGVELAPVLKIQISGKDGAIRIFFRDSDGEMIGDSISCAISGDETHEFIATDGLPDLGAHSAYRTGENPRWMIHVFEGPSADAPLAQFKPLFDTKISADIRGKTGD